MIIFKEVASLIQYIQQHKQAGKKIGFVPTMGALHKGHISLIETAVNSNDVTVCSIFVNPAQFNNAEDFRHYPITIETDIEQLIASGCDCLFLPSVKEIYPPGYPKKTFALGTIENILEGHFRPGHFQGVCLVVDRLLEIVAPDTFFLGQKDYQQCMVLKKLIQLTGRQNSINLFVTPTVREANGLAMSSRNLRLDKEQVNKASAIYKELIYIKNNLTFQSINTLKQTAAKKLTEMKFIVDYVEIANADNLETADNIDQPLVALIAASIGNVRLIDNMLLN